MPALRVRIPQVRLANLICTRSAPARVQLIDFGYATDLRFAQRDAGTMPGLDEFLAVVSDARKEKDAGKSASAMLQKIVSLSGDVHAASLWKKDEQDLARALDSFANTLGYDSDSDSDQPQSPGPGLKPGSELWGFPGVDYGSDSDSDYYDSDDEDDSAAQSS